MFFKKTKRLIAILIGPTIIMLTVTFTSLVLSIKDRAFMLLQGSPNIAVLGMQMGIAVLLLVLGILVAISCGKKLLEKEQANINKTSVKTG